MTRAVLTRPAPNRVLLGVAALVAALVLGACSGEPLPRDAGSGDGSGYGVPQK